MPVITEGKLTFVFEEGWQVTQLDDWSFHRKQFQSVGGGSKAVDILAMGPNDIAWFIEVKDYRQYRRTKILELVDEVAIKVRDSLACVYACQANANDAGEKGFAAAAVRRKKIRVGLVLEQPKNHSRMFPRTFDPAKVQQKLKQLIKAIDAHPVVAEKANQEKLPCIVQ
ncbi:hypothetical protein [Desulfolithobacter sp.]